MDKDIDFLASFQTKRLRSLANEEINNLKISEMKILEEEFKIFKETFKPWQPNAELKIASYLFSKKMKEFVNNWTDSWYKFSEKIISEIITNSFYDLETILIEKSLQIYMRKLLILISRKEAVIHLRKEIEDFVTNEVNVHKIAYTSCKKGNPGLYKDKHIINISIPIADYIVKINSILYYNADFITNKVEIKSDNILTAET